MELRVEIPDELAESLGADPARGALEAIMAELLFQHEVSIGYAAEVLDRPVIDTIQWYTSRGHDYPDYSVEELQDDMRFWQDRPKQS